MKAMRNNHAHKYDRVDFEGMWDTLTQDIPARREKLEKLRCEGHWEDET